jgi:hypothetical protein
VRIASIDDVSVVDPSETGVLACVNFLRERSFGFGKDFCYDLLGFLFVLLQLFLAVVIVMVEDASHEFVGVNLVGRVILHVRVPHEVGHLVGDSDLLGSLRAKVEKLHVVSVAVVFLELGKWEIGDKLMLSEAGIPKPFFCNNARSIGIRV